LNLLHRRVAFLLANAGNHRTPVAHARSASHFPRLPLPLASRAARLSDVRLIAGAVLVASIVACSSSGKGGAAATYVSPTCPVDFNPGAPGSCNPFIDAGPGSCANPPPSSSCQPLPKECVNNPTCDCIACSDSTCGSCIKQGDGQYSDGGGGGATCSYDSASGTFTLTCINA
jgi:hypothetical protein